MQDRDLDALFGLAGMGSESIRAMPAPENGRVLAHQVRLVGEGDGAYFEKDFSPIGKLAEFVDLDATKLSQTQEMEFESLLPQAHELTERELGQALDRFLALDGKPNNVFWNFAKKYGLLGLCYQHGLPYNHPRNEARYGICGLAPLEMVRHWRWLVQWVKAALRIAAHLRENSRFPNKPPDFGSREDWQALDWEAQQAGETVERPTNQQEAQQWLEDYLNYGLIWGEVKPEFDWTSTREPRVKLEGYRLWDNIIRQALFRIAGGQPLCTYCLKPNVSVRARKYCEGCRSAGVPALVRQQRKRERDRRAGTL